MNNSTLSLLFMLALLSVHDLSYSQPRGPFIVSPQIHADKTVTFRYLAPLASDVKLSGQFLKSSVDMKKDSLGIWSITVGPIAPDIYPYSFRVDGVTVMDPANVAYFPNERFKGSLVDVPGDSPLVHAMKDVPHGTVTYEYYPSVENSTGSLVVYTPPGYNKNSSERYPVYYLISGTTDTEETFFKVGRVNLILDNLIAENKAKPMIIVMPYGNPMARIAERTGKPKPSDVMGRDSEDARSRAKLFEIDLVSNVIPYVEKNYRAISDRHSRAIGGFSRGGGQTLRTAFGNLGTFSWICSYSAGLSPSELETNYNSIVADAKKTNEMLDLLWISVGDEDFLYKSNLDFMDYLKSKGINYKSFITSGGHTWMNVKIFLDKSVQLLFQ